MNEALKPTDPSSVKFIRVEEPHEQSFTMDVPIGWTNSLYVHRVYEIVKPVTTAVSPDKGTLLFIGDARMPLFYNPTDVWGNTASLPSQNPLIMVAQPQSAVQYFGNYVKAKFGNNRNFQIISVAPSPIYAQLTVNRAANFGHNINADAVTITLCYEAEGKKYNVIINGTCAYMQGVMWVPAVSGILSFSGKPSDYESILYHMDQSSRESTVWKQRQQQRHQAIMAKLRQDHAQQLQTYNAMNQAHNLRMQNIQASTDAHNRKMQNMQSSFDAQNTNWKNQQASLDKGHESFMNYIRGEHTVANSSGQTFKVDNSHQKYFVNTHNNTYIGTTAHTNVDDLRRLAGVNPSDYQEVKIIR